RNAGPAELADLGRRGRAGRARLRVDRRPPRRIARPRHASYTRAGVVGASRPIVDLEWGTLRLTENSSRRRFVRWPMAALAVAMLGLIAVPSALTATLNSTFTNSVSVTGTQLRTHTTAAGAPRTTNVPPDW